MKGLLFLVFRWEMLRGSCLKSWPPRPHWGWPCSGRNSDEKRKMFLALAFTSTCRRWRSQRMPEWPPRIFFWFSIDITKIYNESSVELCLVIICFNSYKAIKLLITFISTVVGFCFTNLFPLCKVYMSRGRKCLRWIYWISTINQNVVENSAINMPDWSKVTV